MLRQTSGRRDELVALITSATPDRLDAAAWLQRNRQAWGIENGLHHRLDVSRNDDRCRVRHRPALWVLGMFRRLANSLFIEWRSHQPRPHGLTTTHFQAFMASQNHHQAVRWVTKKNPSLKPPS